MKIVCTKTLKTTEDAVQRAESSVCGFGWSECACVLSACRCYLTFFSSMIRENLYRPDWVQFCFFVLFSLLSSAAAVTALRNPIDKLHVCNICNQVSALNVLERKMYAKYKRFVCRFLLASFDFHFVLSTTNETTKKYIYFSLSKTS